MSQPRHHASLRSASQRKTLRRAGRPPPRAPLALVLWGDWAMGLLASKLAFFLAAGTPEAAARAPPGSLRARLGALRERVRSRVAPASSFAVARRSHDLTLARSAPSQGWTRAPFWPTLTGVLLAPTAAAAAALAAPAAALRLLPLLPGGGPRLPGGAREHAWLAEAVLVGTAVGALRARAALAAWVARVHAERCGPHAPLLSLAGSRLRAPRRACGLREQVGLAGSRRATRRPQRCARRSRQRSGMCMAFRFCARSG